MTGLNKLKELREKAGLTQADLADRLFITAQSVSKWENGLSEPNIDTLCKLADMFEVSIDTLLARDIVFKKDITSRLSKQLKNSNFFINDVFDILRASMKSQIGGNIEYDTYSHLMYKDSVFTYSDRTDTPRLSFIVDELSEILNSNHIDYQNYLSALSNENVIKILSKFSELENGVDYDKYSFCKKLKIPDETFENAIDKLILIGVVSKYDLNMNDDKITFYKKQNSNFALSIYAFVKQLFVCKSDGQVLKI